MPVTAAAEPRERSYVAEPDLPGSVWAESTHVQIPSEPEWIVPTVEYLRERAVRSGACSTERADALTLALHEALTNSLVHGNLELSSALKEEGGNVFAEALARAAADPRLGRRPVEIRTDYDGRKCRWTFTDHGAGFDVAAALKRATSDDPEVLLASGRGITLMLAMLDEVRYEQGGRRVVLTLQRGSERRQESRRPVRDTVTVAPLRADGTVDWDAAYPAVARDLSHGGIQLLQTHLATSQRVLIGLENAGEVVYVPAEVRHCKAMGDDIVQLGFRFWLDGHAGSEAAGSYDLAAAISSVLDRHSAPALPEDERRSHQRVVYTEQIEIRGGPGPTLGFGRNLSHSGIGFLVNESLPPEQRVLALPRSDSPPLCVLAQIVRCKALLDGVYEIGARFVGLAE